MALGLKNVHKMFLQGSKPPPRYIVKESKFGLVDRSPPLAPIPTINLSLLLSSSPAPDEELEKLRSALDSWGCFLMTGHGIPPSYLKKVLNATKEFFELPIEQKEKYSRRSSNDGEGYGGDIIFSEKQVLDWSNRLALKLLPEDQRRLELWPEIPDGFREILHDYPVKIKGILDLLFKIMAKLLKLEEDSFLNQFGERALLLARFNFYPPCRNPNEVLGLKPHSDKSGVTILLQDDEVEGLQISKDHEWFKVPVVPHALVVNIGDQMQIMSNGIIKSPVHRVVVNPEKLRVSVSISNEAEQDKEIGPVPELVDEKRPRLYRNVKNYGAINLECFQKGEVAIETVRI
ncbi:OLC1v1038087C1 [Oldenlandia corymbosa var. corymbosa]|uniref:OLC1v1038087C1 n=1 Tax=Oldenlandia corymbosa var. corymbosa TaxID=529605 RepID=A0AAV1D056_OLDCO|nr:OLC1v1038087C1 [Oldenlandia corymbosa var. corymbosa]